VRLAKFKGKTRAQGHFLWRQPLFVQAFLEKKPICQKRFADIPEAHAAKKCDSVWSLASPSAKEERAMIYLDHNATTPVLPEVFEAMRPYFCEDWGNPSSSYRFGSKLKRVLEEARGSVAELIGAQAREVIFTSCGTESNNAAIHAAVAAQPDKKHIVTSQVEHSSVLTYCQTLEREGYRVTCLPVDREGLLSLADLEGSITAELNGHKSLRLSNTTNLTFSGIESEALLLLLDQAGICASSGSACLADSDEPSHVIRAMKPDDGAFRQAIRFSLGTTNTPDEMQKTIATVRSLVETLKSPV
jgi:cysteine sulfinate desulfinase/cysteine desulfurase-like protein